MFPGSSALRQYDPPRQSSIDMISTHRGRRRICSSCGGCELGCSSLALHSRSHRLLSARGHGLLASWIKQFHASAVERTVSYSRHFPMSALLLLSRSSVDVSCSRRPVGRPMVASLAHLVSSGPETRYACVNGGQSVHMGRRLISY